MKAASLLALVFLCACKTQPKTVTVAFNGWHGKDYLKQGCIGLQREYDDVLKLPARTQAALLSLSGKGHTPCLRPAEEMNVWTENQLLSALASNHECHGISFSHGFYDPKTDSATEAGNQFMRADWHLSLDLTPSGNTGDISLADSRWTLNPKEFKSLSGTLADIEKASTDICTIVKGQGGQI
jgi:hypothetical protein